MPCNVAMVNGINELGLLCFIWTLQQQHDVASHNDDNVNNTNICKVYKVSNHEKSEEPSVTSWQVM